MAVNKNNIFQDMTNEQKEVVMSYINLFLQYKHKEQLIGSIGSTGIQAMSSIITAVSFVSERLLIKAKNEPEFQHIFDLLVLSKTKNEIDTELLCIIEEKKQVLLIKLKDILGKLRLEILGKQGQNYLALTNSNGIQKQPLSQKILENAIDSCTDRKLVERHQRIEVEIQIIASSIDFEITAETLAINSKDFNVLEYLAFLIYKPEHRLMSELYLDPLWEKYPFKWLNNLGIADTKTLFDMFKDGENIATFYLARFERKEIDSIRELVNNPIARTPIANAKDYKEIQIAIEQALLCYENKWYSAFLYTILPILEGVLWRYATYLNNIGEVKIFTSLNKKSILLSSGKLIENPTIGTLLKNSEFSNFFDLEFIQYFCDELYNERNPVLHGESYNLATMENATKKLATLEYIFETMKVFMEMKIINNFNMLPSETIKVLMDTFSQKYSKTYTLPKK